MAEAKLCGRIETVALIAGFLGRWNPHLAGWFLASRLLLFSLFARWERFLHSVEDSSSSF